MIIKKEERWYIYQTTTEEAVKEAQGLIERLKLEESFRYAEMRYSTETLPWTSERMEECNYPLHLVFANDELRISAVTAGYSGTGPHGTLEILKSLGVEIPRVEAYILGERGKEVFLRIFPDGSIERL